MWKDLNKDYEEFLEAMREDRMIERVRAGKIEAGSITAVKLEIFGGERSLMPIRQTGSGWKIENVQGNIFR